MLINNVPHLPVYVIQIKTKTPDFGLWFRHQEVAKSKNEPHRRAPHARFRLKRLLVFSDTNSPWVWNFFSRKNWTHSQPTVAKPSKLPLESKVLYDTANIEMTPTPQTNESDCGKFLCGTHATPHQKLWIFYMVCVGPMTFHTTKF